jgi:hypothetical protein
MLQAKLPAAAEQRSRQMHKEDVLQCLICSLFRMQRVPAVQANAQLLPVV